MPDGTKHRKRDAEKSAGGTYNEKGNTRNKKKTPREAETQSEKEKLEKERPTVATKKGHQKRPDPV